MSNSSCFLNINGGPDFGLRPVAILCRWFAKLHERWNEPDGFLDLRLKAVQGPGHFFARQASQFGGHEVKMNSADGITDSDKTEPLLGSHEHFNWGFTTSGVYRITFQASGRRIGESINILSPETTFTFHVLPLSAETPFQVWQRMHWPAGTAESVRGPTADSDGDGIVNLMEYALNMNPTQAGREGLPTLTVIVEGLEQVPVFSFTRVKAAKDLAYRALASESIAGSEWRPLLDPFHVQDQGAVEIVTFRDSVLGRTAMRMFYQLQVIFRR